MPKRDGQLHPTFPPFQRWVIEKLVGIYANDSTNVLLQIVMQWIDQNREGLKEYGISYEEWRKAQGPQGVVKRLQGSSKGEEPSNLTREDG